MISVRNRLPIVLCTTLGLKQETEPSLQTMRLTPNQSAVRMMVPKFPGSCRWSRASVRGQLLLGSGKCLSTSIHTSLGVCMWLRRESVSCSTSYISASSGRLLC